MLCGWVILSEYWVWSKQPKQPRQGPCMMLLAGFFLRGVTSRQCNFNTVCLKRSKRCLWRWLCWQREGKWGESATHYRWLTLVPSTSFSGVTLLRQIHGITVLKSQALLNRMTLEYHILCLPLFTSAFQRIFEGVRLLKARKAENPTLTFMTRYNVTPSESPMLER